METEARNEHNAEGGREHITLTEAAKLAPGRPSTNCLWRWCRRGVLSRAAERIYLRHIRVGGKVYTSKQWLDDFGQTLAEADAAYFRNEEGPAPQHAPSRPKRRRERFEQHRRETVEQASQELEDAGL